jgi:23S rRNA (uridine2552-2'-O)-methyltransferase
LEMEPVAGSITLQLDFLDASAPARLKQALGGPADVVLSDMAAPTTGHTKTDHLRIMGLAEVAYEFAASVLSPGGAFVCKLFQGGAERLLLDRLKRDFASVKHAKPPASRADSAETYVVATGFRGTGEDVTPS